MRNRNSDNRQNVNWWDISNAMIMYDFANNVAKHRSQRLRAKLEAGELSKFQEFILFNKYGFAVCYVVAAVIVLLYKILH